MCIKNKAEEKNDSDEKMHINLCLYSLMSFMFYFIRIFQTLSFILLILYQMHTQHPCELITIDVNIKATDKLSE